MGNTCIDSEDKGYTPVQPADSQVEVSIFLGTGERNSNPCISRCTLYTN